MITLKNAPEKNGLTMEEVMMFQPGTKIYRAFFMDRLHPKIEERVIGYFFSYTGYALGYTHKTIRFTLPDVEITLPHEFYPESVNSFSLRDLIGYESSACFLTQDDAKKWIFAHAQAIENDPIYKIQCLLEDKVDRYLEEKYWIEDNERFNSD